jgi:hypothetical protein
MIWVLWWRGSNEFLLSYMYSLHYRHVEPLSTCEISMALKQKQPTMLLKWFYDTFIGVSTRAARCGFFIGEGFGLSDASYG